MPIKVSSDCSVGNSALGLALRLITLLNDTWKHIHDFIDDPHTFTRKRTKTGRNRFKEIAILSAIKI